MTHTKPLTLEQVLDALADTATVKEAAAALGVSERTLYRRMGEFGLRFKRSVVRSLVLDDAA